MSNIRVDLDYTIRDGLELKFRSPVDCSAITGLIVYYPGADGNITSKEFVLADAHGNNVGDIDHLFAENVVVKVILDVTTSMAFVQNADTNAYLEAQLAAKAPTSHNHAASDITSGLLPLERGGTNRNLSAIEPNAIIRAASNGTALLSTPTANGAFFATAANGAGKFGTLPIAQGGTGATTAAQALANLGAVPKLVNVNKAGTDLNDYTEEGVYVFSSSYTPTNIPAGSNGWLVVLGGVNNYIKQIWYRWGTPGTNDQQTYVRTGTASGWGEWASYLTSRDYARADTNSSHLYAHFARIGKFVICTLKPKVNINTVVYESGLTIPSGFIPATTYYINFYSHTSKNAGEDGAAAIYFAAANHGYSPKQVFISSAGGVTIGEALGTYCWIAE